MVGSWSGERGLTAPDPSVRLGRRTLLVLGLFLVLQGFWYALLNSPGARPLKGDETRYQNEALSIASGVTPPPEFLWPPLQKWFLAGVFTLFGAGPVPLGLFQTLLLAVSGVIFWRLVVFSGAGILAADVALALYLFDPQIGSFAFCLWPEVTYLFLFLSALGFLFLESPPHLLRLVLGGACLGLALLAKSVLGPFIPFIALAVALREEGIRPALRWLRMAAMASGLALVVLPVIISNGVHYGIWSVGSSGVFNLWVGLDDPRSRTDYDSVVSKGYAAYMASGRTPEERDRVAFAHVKEKVEAQGLTRIVRQQLEKQYVRLFDKNSFFTDQLAGGRFRPQEAVPAPAALARAAAWALYGVTLALAGIGLFVVPWSVIRSRLWLPLLYLFYCVGILLVLHVKTRYRVAFLPCLDLLAGCAVAWLFRKRSDEPDSMAARPRWLYPAAGMAVSAFLLWLAFPIP